MSESITLRSHLTGSLNDLVESASLGALGKCSLVCELVSLFADYQEEGTSLFLDAFLTDDLGRLTALIPQSALLPLGKAACNEGGVRTAIKKTAPLVRGCWKMYLSLSTDGFNFGLFRDSGHPLNVPLDITLRSGDVGDAKFIRITRLAQDSVRVSVHDGRELIVHFTNAKEGVGDVGHSLAALCEIICSDLDEKLAQSCRTYLASLLSTAVRESHGSLIAVVSGVRIPAFLADSTKLNPPIDLNEAVESVLRSANAIPQLSALESVICGMFRCDGIVVFDTKARVVAYNAFTKLKASNVVGGARRRAYRALCDKVGKGLQGAFFQSQDGVSDLQKVTS